MTIKIIPDASEDITLTESEYARLRQEYSKAFSMYSGPLPTFEEWVRRKQTKLLNEKFKDHLQN